MNTRRGFLATLTTAIAGTASVGGLTYHCNSSGCSDARNRISTTSVFNEHTSISSAEGTVHLSNASAGGLAFDSERVYFADIRGNYTIGAVDHRTGDIVWSKAVPATKICTPRPVGDIVLFVSQADSGATKGAQQIFACDPETGEYIWERRSEPGLEDNHILLREGSDKSNLKPLINNRLTVNDEVLIFRYSINPYSSDDKPARFGIGAMNISDGALRWFFPIGNDTGLEALALNADSVLLLLEYHNEGDTGDRDDEERRWGLAGLDPEEGELQFFLPFGQTVADAPEYQRGNIIDYDDRTLLVEIERQIGNKYYAIDLTGENSKTILWEDEYRDLFTKKLQDRRQKSESRNLRKYIYGDVIYLHHNPPRRLVKIDKDTGELLWEKEGRFHRVFPLKDDLYTLGWPAETYKNRVLSTERVFRRHDPATGDVEEKYYIDEESSALYKRSNQDLTAIMGSGRIDQYSI